MADVHVEKYHRDGDGPHDRQVLREGLVADSDSEEREGVDACEAPAREKLASPTA